MDNDAVWSRVLSPSAEARWEERLLWRSQALEEDLFRLVPVRREQQEVSALLKGIRALEGAKPLTGPIPRRREGDLRQCYRRSLALAREFAARAAHPETGPLWQTAADRQLAQCVRIAKALGSAPIP